MAKTTIKLPQPYIAKLKAVKAAKAANVVAAMYGIPLSTFCDVAERGSVSEIPLQTFNAFFANFGDAESRLPPLDFGQFLAQTMPAIDLGEPSEIETKAVAHLNQTGDIWSAIRTLYLDRRNDEALALAQSGLRSPDLATKLASAQSLIYLNQRLGRLSAAARAIDIFRRIVADHPKLLSIEQRVRTTNDIAKCLSENGYPRLAAPLFDRLRELCDRPANSIPKQLAASVLRGICESRFLRKDYIGARQVLQSAIESGQADTTLGTRLTHVNAMVLFSADDERTSPRFYKAWDNLAEALDSLRLPPPAQLTLTDSAAPPDLPLTTLNAVLVTSAFSAPKRNPRDISELIDARADWLYRAGLSDNRVLSYGTLSHAFVADVVEPMRKDHPGLRIFQSMIKTKLRKSDAAQLVTSASQLLKQLS